MEHKVQNSLDTIECNLSTGSELCGIRLMTGRCKDCNTKEDLKTIQNLIDCQLTIKEIDYMICYLEDLLLGLEQGYIRCILEKIIEKFKVQRGMWTD